MKDQKEFNFEKAHNDYFKNVLPILRKCNDGFCKKNVDLLVETMDSFLKRNDLFHINYNIAYLRNERMFTFSGENNNDKITLFLIVSCAPNIYYK